MSAIPEDLIERAKRVTGKRTAAAALRVLVNRAEDNEPTAATVHAIRSRKRGKIFASAGDAIRYLKAL